MARPLILVHGSYHRPAHYEPLVDLLRAHTGTVIVPDIGQLPLVDATAAVQAIVDELPEPPVVVAHSFGGAVGGALHGISQLVFLAAFVLDTGQSANDVLALTDELGVAAQFMAALRPSADGTMFAIDPDMAGDLFFNGCEPDRVRRGIELLRPDLAANFAATPAAAEWRNTPSLYIRARHDRTWPPALPPVLAGRCTESVEIGSGHAPFVSHPVELAGLISPFI